MDQGSAHPTLSDIRKAAICVAAAGWISLDATGCATVPAGPQVMVLPGSHKTLAQFEADDASCRQWASRQIGVTPKATAANPTASGAAIGTVGSGAKRWSVQTRYDVAYVQCMYASGHQVPVSRGSMQAPGRAGAITIDDLRSSIPPPPAGIPPPPPPGPVR